MSRSPDPRFTRRAALSQVAASSAAAALLPWLRPRSANAAGIPTRLVLWWQGSGVPRHLYTFKSAAELRTLFAPALSSTQVLTYCGGGIAATSVAFVLAMLGYDQVKVYDNSLTEWAADASLPMETGA